MDNVPLTLFVDAGLTEQEILDIKATALANITSGKVLVSWGAAGNSVGKTLAGTPASILQAVGFALRKINPDIYGRNITRTVAKFAPDTVLE